MARKPQVDSSSSNIIRFPARPRVTAPRKNFDLFVSTINATPDEKELLIRELVRDIAQTLSGRA